MEEQERQLLRGLGYDAWLALEDGQDDGEGEGDGQAGRG